MIKNEIKNAFSNKVFLFFVGVIVLITIINLVYVYLTTNTSLVHVNVLYFWVGTSRVPAMLNLNKILFLLFVFIVSLPYSLSTRKELNSNYIAIKITRMGFYKYYVAKTIASFLSGAFCFTAPFFISAIVSICLFPSAGLNRDGDSLYILFNYFAYHHMLLYILIYLVLIALYSGVISIFSFFISLLIKNIYVCSVAPFLIMLFIKVVSDLGTSFLDYGALVNPVQPITVSMYVVILTPFMYLLISLGGSFLGLKKNVYF